MKRRDLLKMSMLSGLAAATTGRAVAADACPADGTPAQFVPKTAPDANPLENELTIFNTNTGIVNFTEVADNNWSLADLATNFDVQTPLPAIFGNNISATSKNGQLSVQWQSLNEVNNIGYTVEASKDGNNWVPIGTVHSLASNGNSSGTLDYSFFTSSLPISLAGLSIAFLLGAIFKSRIVRLIIAVVVVGAVVFSCSKDTNEQVSTDKFDNLYIRVASKDINQHINYSKVVKVQNL